MQPLLTRLLDLPGMDVEDYHDQGDRLILDVEAHHTKAVCPRCGEESQKLHQNHGHLVRDLSISERPVWLRVNRRQFRCLPCGKPFSEEFEFMGKRCAYTDRYAAMIVQHVRHSDMHNVGLNHGLTDEMVASMVNYYSKKNERGCDATAPTRD
jgi:transposase